MPGFMSSKTAMTICHVESPATFTVESLRNGAFSDAINPDGLRFGWTGLGEPLDFDNFFLATCDGRFHGFSFRVDSRKPSGAVIRLRVAEKIREEEQAGRKVGAARKKEIREAVTEAITSRAEFVPLLVDCVWDAEKNDLLAATASEKIIEFVLEHFKGCFRMEANILEPQKDMTAIFSAIQNNNGLNAAGYFLQPMGSASLESEDQASEKSVISVQNSVEAVSNALRNGLEINKLSLVATSESNEEEQINFTIDSALKVSALALPKAEKGADDEATFLINAAIAASVAAITREISR